MNLRTLALLPPVLLATGTIEEHSLVASYPEGLALTETSESTFSMEATGTTVTVDGNELPPEIVEQMGVGALSEQTVSSTRILHVVRASEDDRPTRLERTFETLERTVTKNGEDDEQTGVFAGETLILTESDGEVEVEVEGDTEVDDLHLENHRITFSTDPLLPEEEVEVGATWTIEGDELFRFVGMDEGPVYFEPDEEEDEDSGPDFEETMRENGEISGEVTFEEVEELDGVRCAVLTWEVELQTELDDLAEDFFGAPQEMTGALDILVTATGKVWIALDGGYPMRSEGTVGGDLEMRMAMEVEAQGQTLDMEITLEITPEGSGETTWELTEED